MSNRRTLMAVVTPSLVVPLREARRVIQLLAEWRSDWRLAGRAPRTVRDYCVLVAPLLIEHERPTLADVKQYVADAPTPNVARMRGRACRAFFRWVTDEQIHDYSWWTRIPMPAVPETPQPTLTPAEYRAAINTGNLRDRALLATAWSTGMRLSELARIEEAHIDYDNNCILVPQAKNGHPRVAPMSPEAAKAIRVLRRFDCQRPGPIFGTQAAVKSRFRRMGVSAHSVRRGWAVESLRQGISQTSVQYAAGWKPNGVMVSRYTKALAQELSMAEFGRRWSA